MHNNKIIITGAGGQLGQALLAEFPGANGLSSSELNITLKDKIDDVFTTHSPSLVINCAAYTNVEKAEEEKELAMKVNSDSVGYLAKCCKVANIPLIHFSTDYVFNGSGTPLKEDDPTSPLNHYGLSKLSGEKLALQHHPNTWIFRLSWLYSNKHNNFKNTIIRKGDDEQLTIVDDQISSPTYAVHLAKDIKLILNQILNRTSKPGVYHYSHSGETSWYGFAKEIKKNYQLKSKIVPVKSHEFQTKAERPGYSKMDASNFFLKFGIPQIHWKEALEVCSLKDNKNGQ
ncbi:MAG: dTDP-4-dehydrorhamnose reductase [Bacteroidota bacterium]